MWNDYFPRATIVGLDGRSSTPCIARDFLYVHGRQEDPAALDQAIELLGGSATVIIDDCSHQRAPTEFALRHLWPFLEPGGLYFIEDIHVSWRKKWAPTNPHGGLAGLVLECAKTMHEAPEALPGLRAIDLRWRVAVLHKL
jgi:hypothetical protein